MKTLSRRFLGFLIIFSLLFSYVPTVFAEGTTMIDFSNKSPAVGDTVTVTVSGSESSTITLKYNGSILSFSSCNVSGYTTDGNTVSFAATSGSVTFSVVGEGSANVIVSSDTLTGSSATLTVASATTETEETTTEDTSQTDESSDTQEDTNTEDTSTEEASTEENTQTTTEDVAYDFMYGDTAYVISKRFTEDQILAGFEETTLSIHGTDYRALTNGVLNLLYLKLATDTYGQGTFFIYDSNSDSVSELNMLGTTEDYVILMTPDSLPSDQLVETTYSDDEKTFSAYQIDGLSNEFYYVYGIDETATAGWFVFNSSDGSVGRANTDAFTLMSNGGTSTESTDNDDTSKDTSFNFKLPEMRNIIAVLILVAAVVAVIIINVMVSRRRDDDDDVFDDADEEDEDEEEVVVKPSVNSQDESTSKEEEGEEKTLEEIVSEADSDLILDDEEEEEEEERRGFFFRRRKKDEEDIWADHDDEDEEDEDEDDDDDDNNSSNGGSGSNREINLMDLNNL